MSDGRLTAGLYAYDSEVIEPKPFTYTYEAFHRYPHTVHSALQMLPGALPTSFENERRVRTLRIEVDPNQVVKSDHTLSAVRLSAFGDTPPTPGQVVVAIQTDDEDERGNYVSTASVVRVNHKYELVYLRVDWRGFHHEQQARPQLGAWHNNASTHWSRVVESEGRVPRETVSANYGNGISVNYRELVAG